MHQVLGFSRPWRLGSVKGFSPNSYRLHWKLRSLNTLFNLVLHSLLQKWCTRWASCSQDYRQSIRPLAYAEELVGAFPAVNCSRAPKAVMQPRDGTPRAGWKAAVITASGLGVQNHLHCYQELGTAAWRQPCNQVSLQSDSTVITT